MEIKKHFIEYLFENKKSVKIDEACDFLKIDVRDLVDICKELLDLGVKIDINKDLGLITLDSKEGFDELLTNALICSDLYEITFFYQLQSSNTYILENCERLKAGTVCVALNQTAGRGRHDRSFYSYDGGLYFSLLLKFDSFELANKKYDLTFFTCASAIALAQALRSTLGVKAVIKWVNDIYIEGKKVAGILAESRTDTNGKINLALGVGVNLMPVTFSEDLIETANFITDKTVSKEVVLANTLENLEIILCDMTRSEILKKYRELMYLKCKKVILHNLYNESEKEVQVLGVNKHLKLVVREGIKIYTITNEEIKMKVK